MADDPDIATELGALTVELAVGAARRVRRWRTEGFAVTAKSTPTDLVTEVDGRVERWMAGQLQRRRPGDGLVGEEGTADMPAAGGPGHQGHEGHQGHPSVRWLVDPIDGTVNFALGLPHYGISVAAELDGQVVAGCVVNPVSRDVFRAIRGGGAYLDPAGRSPFAIRLLGPRPVALDRAVVSTGFGYESARRARQGQVVGRLLPRIADLRRVGAASLDLCSVAAGWLDAHYEAGLHIWDYAAGLLIATEAGCVSSGLRGRPAGDRCCAVAGPDLAPALFGLLEELDADRVLD